MLFPERLGFGPKMSDQTKTIRSEVSKLNRTSSLGPHCMVNGFDTKSCFIVFPHGSTKIMNFVAKMPFFTLLTIPSHFVQMGNKRLNG